MDELGSESAPKFSRSDIKSRVSDTILERMEAILIQKPNPQLLLAVYMLDLFSFLGPLDTGQILLAAFQTNQVESTRLDLSLHCRTIPVFLPKCTFLHHSLELVNPDWQH